MIFLLIWFIAFIYCLLNWFLATTTNIFAIMPDWLLHVFSALFIIAFATWIFSAIIGILVFIIDHL